MPSNNSIQLLSLLIKELDIPVTRQGIASEVEKHPNSFSLRAISDALDNWKIPNEAYRVSADELSEAEIPLPFIASFAKGEFVLVTGKSGERFTVSNDGLNKHQLSLDEFKGHYQGTILAFEKDPESGEPNYSNQKRREVVETLRIPFLISVAAVLVVTYLLLHQALLSAFNWDNAILILLKLTGVAVSILLLIQSIDVNNPLIKKFCGADSNKNCNVILASGAAKLTDELSWSEIGFFYFAGTALALFFNVADTCLIQLLAFLNILSLPYTFYSIYYQWRIAKQWCIFCCTVQALLWLEFFAFLPYLLNAIHSPGYQHLGNLLLALLSPILVWAFIKPFLKDANQLQILKPELYKYKYNKELFQNMLRNEAKYALLPEGHAITMGNREASNVVTFVSNPFCVHCSKTHKLLDELLETREDLKLQLIFISRLNEKEKDRKVMGHFMSLDFAKDEEKARKAINDWYSQEKKDYEVWKNKFPITETRLEPEMLTMQKEWCWKVNITSTPTLFINGYRLPEAYQADDLRYLL